MATGGQIIIAIKAEMTKFLAELQNGFSQGLTQAQTFATNIKTTLTNAFNQANVAQQQYQQTAAKLSATFTQSKAQLDLLKASTASYLTTISSATVTSQQYSNAMTALPNIMAAYGVSLRKAAQIAVETGQAELMAINQVLMARGRMPLSLQAGNQSLGILAVNTNRAAQGLSLLNSSASGTTGGLNNAGNAANNAGERMGFLANRLRGVITNLIIVTAVFKLFQLFSELAKGADDVSQSMFNFEASLKAAQLTLGASVGTYDSWTDTIKRLRLEFQVFSERDIRTAVTQTLNLTKALNLTQAQMEDIIKIAAALAKTTGVDLEQAVSDVVHALGGSKVVLDKYGLFLRDSDLRVVSLNLGLGKNTAALTSQQLALVTLNAIMAQTANLIQATSNYTETFAGQVKATDAQISDTSDRISELLGPLALQIKNLWAELLIFIEGVIMKMQPFLKILEDANNKLQISKDLSAAGINAPDYRDYGLELGNMAGPLANLKSDQVKEGYNRMFIEDIANVNRYINTGKATVEQYEAFLQAIRDYQEEEARLVTSRDPRYNQGPRYNAPTPDTLSTDEEEAVAQFEIDVVDLLEERRQALADAKAGFINDMFNLISESRQALAELDAQFQDAKEKLGIKTGYANEDALTNYNRQLEDLDIDSSNDIEDAGAERDKKLIDNKKKYYDALKALDRQYFFDLFDAVAANDAVAIKEAERKYNLDKAKLQDKLDDENNIANDNYEEDIENIRQRTEERRAELRLRYERELADIATQHARELLQLNKDYEKEKAATIKHYDDLQIALSRKYENEKKLINKEFDDRYTKLAADLQKELTAHKNEWAALVNGWGKYFDDQLELEEKYLRAKEDLEERYDYQGGIIGGCLAGWHWDTRIMECVPNDRTTGGGGNHGCLTGWHWDGIECVPDDMQGQSDLTTSSTGGGNTLRLVIGSDGTLSEDIVDKVTGEIANLVQDIIVERGNR